VFRTFSLQPGKQEISDKLFIHETTPAQYHIYCVEPAFKLDKTWERKHCSGTLYSYSGALINQA